MSRQHSPSPGGHPPQHMHSNQPYQLHAVASSSSASGANSNPNKQSQQKSKGFAPGITASAEDGKYQTKYKELKRKVKEIELDNDKLYLKLLLAKKNIRRMNLERAILYERLAAVPPTPGRPTHELPPELDPVFAPQHPQDHPRGLDVNDQALAQYLHTHPSARVVRGTDGRIVAIEDNPALDLPGQSSGAPPPHGIPLVRGFQHESGPGFDPQRPLPALPPGSGVPPPPPGSVHDTYGPSHPQQPHEPHISNSRSAGAHRDRDRELPPPAGWQAQEPPSARPPSNNSTSSHHHRDRSRHRHSHSHVHPHDIDPVSGGPIPPGPEHGGRLDTLPPVQHRSRRGSVSESEGRGRRHDLHDLAYQGHDHGHPHMQVTQSGGPGSPPRGHSPSASRSGRLHHHQRVGPGAHIHRERDAEYDRELYHAREIERVEEVERARDLRERMAMEEQELRSGTQWVREEQGGMSVPHGRSRSDTPVSNDASRPPSGQSYERDHRASRGPYAAAPGGGSRNVLGLDGSEYGYDERSGDSRKRSRNDMEVDTDRDRDREREFRYAGESLLPMQQHGASAARMGMDEGGYMDNRGSKRMHQVHDDRDRDGQMSAVRDEGPMDQDD
ncbi:hypothetical protein BXZ70DRAFT_1078817 [Cristinia sonorae]|uniref:INO80 complex subunit F domain-containing protein n=1 Tax=Cristinia sonorae TaxID=1940300 RepID=A0A8K0UJW3_9AGAR|nr:hypothetical protein BXZ70DRAFT_1078817 [Cristinia sonorae]